MGDFKEEEEKGERMKRYCLREATKFSLKQLLTLMLLYVSLLIVMISVVFILGYFEGFIRNTIDVSEKDYFVSGIRSNG